MQRLKQKYPGLFSFLRNRFKTGIFFGLPFTILLLLIGINVIMLSELAENVVNSPQLKTLDMEASAALFNIRTPLLSQMLYYFTKLGSVYGITTITLLAAVWLILKNRLIQLVTLLLSVLGSSITMHYSKIYFQRERPLNFAYYVPENSFSFPSGHSTSIMALIGIICYFIFIDAQPKWLRNLLLLLGGSLILSVGFSRIYLGVHFLTDVTAGYMLGFLWVMLAVGFMEYLTLRQLRRTAKLATK